MSKQRDERLKSLDRRFFIKQHKERKSVEEIAEDIVAEWGGGCVRRRNSENTFGKHLNKYPICSECKSLLRDGICPNEHCERFQK